MPPDEHLGVRRIKKVFPRDTDGRSGGGSAEKQDQFVHAPTKGQLPLRRGTTDSRFEDKITALKAESFPKRVISEPHCARKGTSTSTPSRSTKPWPGRNASSAHLHDQHNVPTVLVKAEREEDHLKGKASDFCALDWDASGRWTTPQKHAAEQNCRISTACTKESVLVSASPPTDKHVVSHLRQELRVNEGSMRTQLMQKGSSFTAAVDCLAIQCSTGNAGDCNKMIALNQGVSVGSSQSQTLPESRSDVLFADAISAYDPPTATGHFGNSRLTSAFRVKSEFSGDHVQQSKDVRLNSNYARTHHIEMESFHVSLFDDACPGTSSTDAPETKSGAEELKLVPNQFAASKKELACVPSSGTVNPVSSNCSVKDGKERMMPQCIRRSCSPKRTGATVQQTELPACVDLDDREKATPNSKGRRSPLRRMLDPFLKPINRMYSPSPAERTSARRVLELGCIEKQPVKACSSALLHDQPSSVAREARASSSMREELSSCSHTLDRCEDSAQPKRVAASTRQGLLRIGWKNGVPLFMLSSGDNDVLAATFSKKSINDKTEQESVYTIFTVQEPKKKGNAWMKSGSKNKQHLVSNAVGELSVSCFRAYCDSSRSSSHVVQKCVLVQSNNELATIVCKVTEPHTTSYSRAPASQRSSCIGSNSEGVAKKPCSCPPLKTVQMEKCNSSSTSPSIIAILPKGIHGLSANGEPTPLMERWQSGGACDCGGWDEGCEFIVLTDSQHTTKINQINQAADGTRRIELFSQVCEASTCMSMSTANCMFMSAARHPQARSQQEGQVFSMISFKEGLYTVEFGSIITLLQAFTTCISVLHGRIRNKPADVRYPASGKVRKPSTTGDAARCPPALSPVCRS